MRSGAREFLNSPVQIDELVGALDRVSTGLAAVLADMGVKRQDRVVIFMENSPETIISLYGILKAGGVFVILDGSLKARNLGYILEDCSTAAVIAHTGKVAVVRDAVSRSKRPYPILWCGDRSAIPAIPGHQALAWSDVVGRSSSLFRATQGTAGNRRCIDLDLAALIYTSGSTGEPKGVMSSHLNMISAARSIIHYLENTPRDIILNILPLSFDYGLFQVIMAVMFGGTVVLEKSYLYPIKLLERIQQDQVTGFPIVPTVAALLLRIGTLRDYDLSSLRYITNTASPLLVEHIRRLRALLPHVRIYSMYGLTECKRVSYLPPEDLDRRPASVGKAIPNTEALVVDEHGREAGPGEIGELVVRGTHVTCGYWNSPDLTAQIFRPGSVPGERLLHTGDLFTKDTEGFLYFVGRKDDMIKPKGERVSPREVEVVLREMDGIAEAAVVGVADEILGQVLKAFVVPAPGAMLRERDILRHCGRNLEPFKVPKHIEFVVELFKTSNGKIDRRGLKRRHPKVTWSLRPPTDRHDRGVQ